ncbi:MAG TPA: glycosyltransferase family 4 protein [Acidimicrobiales bacterium]|nr:glycosyltransferase family 4 protein [Acidimicrobiales bacterium]
MRVGLVCPYSLSLPGGVQGQVLGLARSMRKLGHEARVLGPCDGPPPEVAVIPLGNTLATLANGSVAPLAPDLPCVLRTMGALEDEDFDVLHLHEPLAPGPTLTSVVLSPAPTVGTFHAAGRSAAYRWLRPLARWLGRRLTVRCAVSEDARDMAAKALGGEYVVLHNGIDVEWLAKATPWPTTGPTVAFVSRHEERKGLGVLLAALGHLPHDVRLWVASDGPETARLQAQVAGDPRVEWLGRITEEEKAQRLRGADVLCAPSLRGESFGMVLLEGMAAQTPVVASDLPGYRNVGRHGREALLVPPGDARALAGAITQVLEEPSFAATLVAGGEARAAEFSMDRLAERYLGLYEEARARQGRPAA